VDPLTAILGIALVFFAVTFLILGWAFVAAYRRVPGAPQGQPKTFFDIFPRRVVLVATGAGMIGCVALGAFWIWFVLID
jgi:ABC-type uncharacterized transport system permease subunit